MLAMLMPVLLAGAGLPAADSAALDRTVAEIYRPYSREANSVSAWERPIFSAATAALIARWRRVAPTDEVDDLSDGDWLCLCQDWDAAAFRAAIRSRAMLRADAAQLRVRIDLGGGAQRDVRLVLLRQAGRWKLDDMVSSDYPRGLKQALREIIAAGERLPK